MSAPTTDNAFADFVNGVINALMVGGETAAEAYITALDPAVLSNPLIAWLIDEGVEYIGQIADAFLAKGATAIVIDVQVNGEKSTAVMAAVALQTAINSGDQNAIAQATSNAAQAYAGVIHWDGSATNVPN